MELVEQCRVLSYRVFLALAHGLHLPVNCPLDAHMSIRPIKWTPVTRQTLSSMDVSIAWAGGWGEGGVSCPFVF